MEDAAPIKEKKSRISRPEKPDRSKLDAQITTLREQISKCHDKMGELKTQIDGIKGGRKGWDAATKEPRSKLVEFRTELKAIYEEKNGIQKQLQAMDAQRDQLRAQQKAIREKCQYVKVEQIDEAIDRLENEMAHTTMSLNDEKKLIAQVSDLRKSRALVKELSESSEKGLEGASRDEVMDRLRACNGKIKALRQQEDEQRKIIDEIKASFDTNKDEVPALVQEKSNQYEIVKQCKETIGKLRDDFKKVEDEYWTKERAWRAQQKEEKQKRYEAAQEEKKKRDLERKQRELDNAGEPFDREVTNCEQLISYLGKFKEEGSSKGTVSSAPVKAQEGMVLVGKKNVEEEIDGWFAGLGSGKKKGKKNKEKSEKIVHTMDIISSFASLGLTAPQNKTVMPELIEKINVIKADFLEKRKVENVKRAAKKEAMAAAIAAGEDPDAETGEPNGVANGTSEPEAKEEVPAAAEEES